MLFGPVVTNYGLMEPNIAEFRRFPRRQKYYNPGIDAQCIRSCSCTAAVVDQQGKDGGATRPVPVEEPTRSRQSHGRKRDGERFVDVRERMLPEWRPNDSRREMRHDIACGEAIEDQGEDVRHHIYLLLNIADGQNW